MMKAIKKLLHAWLNRRGLMLYPVEGPATMLGALRRLSANGIDPGCIIDVGAATGAFSLEARRYFPKARFLLLEPLSEFDQAVDRACRLLGTARRIKAAAGAESGKAGFNVHADLFGSSLLSEHEDGVDGKPRSVDVVCLDDVVGEPGPHLLKIDVQGGELNVLRGAKRILECTEAIILEASFFPFFKDGPLFDEVIDELRGMGFVVYDLAGLSHRPLDGALAQLDLVFVPKHSPLRKEAHLFATPKQRLSLDKRLRRAGAKAAADI